MREKLLMQTGCQQYWRNTSGPQKMNTAQKRIVARVEELLWWCDTLKRLQAGAFASFPLFASVKPTAQAVFVPLAELPPVRQE
jgi:hypothetical protein